MPGTACFTQPFAEKLPGQADAVDPSQTYERYGRHISPITGIVDNLALHHLDERHFCYSFLNHQKHIIRRKRDLFFHNQERHFGKGFTHMDAKAAALGEAVERFSLMDQRPPDRIRDCYQNLVDVAVDPATLIHYSAWQYELQSKGGKKIHLSERVPAQPFDPGAVIGWTQGWSLTHAEIRYVPSDLCWLTGPYDGAFFIANTNGCAAGNSHGEAILNGLLELIERDAVAIWWYNRTDQAGIQMDACDDPRLARLAESGTALERQAWLLDLTTDIGIPVVAAMSARMKGARQEFLFGFGCHLRLGTAARSAALEMIQGVTYCAPFLTLPKTCDVSHAAHEDTAPNIRAWLQRTDLGQPSYLYPDPGQPWRSDFAPESNLPSQADETIKYCVQRLAELGIEVIVVDMTRPDMGMPVVRVLATELRFHWRQLGPGRLYTVPVKMGRLRRPHREADLNPVTLFF
jgi:ribosomal protein S12 methylthiotransferase accessory factor